MPSYLFGSAKFGAARMDDPPPTSSVELSTSGKGSDVEQSFFAMPFEMNAAREGRDVRYAARQY